MGMAATGRFAEPPKPGIGHNSARNRSMFAIVFDLDQQMLQNSYHNPSYQNAYGDIRKSLESKGFEWKQGSTYFGNDSVDAVSCVLAVQDLARKFSWFSPSVRDIRMLRIEDNNDLMPAVEALS